MKRFLVIFLIFFCRIPLVSATSIEKIVLTNRVSGIFQDSPRAALNIRTGRTLVVWEQRNAEGTSHSLWGHLLNSDGFPAGPSFLIVKGPDARQPDLVYNPALNRFLLVYDNDIKRNNHFAIFSLHLSAKGRAAGKAVRVSALTDSRQSISNLNPRVILDSEANAYTVFWLHTALSTSSSIQEGLLGSVLNADLSIKVATVQLHPLLREGSKLRGPFLTDLVFRPSTEKILLAGYVIQNLRSFSWEYFVSSVNATLQKPAIRLFTVNPSPSAGAQFDCKLAAGEDGQPFVVFVDGTGLKRRPLNARARPAGSVTPFFNPPLQLTKVEFPEVKTDSVNGVSQRFVFAVEVNIPAEKIWFQSFNAAGVASGTPIELASSPDRVSNPVAILLPATPQTPFRYALVYVEGRQQFPAGANDSSGLTLLKITITE